ncbi:acyl-CoA N-acyltransferase [Aspergillus sclerotioniger CBS 115572]|uniref:Acyl-CoA N-acyltransferase n=1 Tax=Aspergillus sclerotioniger CBS 115572 TaxID=1450535 RepID=A0A317W6Q3_9EURO|nr:acyl-CoA N-acyltransferase [Aspergillus sclerotioniger CBS 115572]PWY81635.1 acyl-CoA N-acyltransferase [Aspergillus sclerotioniger CBS 115572]
MTETRTMCCTCLTLHNPWRPSTGCPLKLEFATIDDVPELTQLWYNAFSPSMLKVWPDTPGVRQWWESANRHDMLNKPCEKYLKVVDPNNEGRIAAYAKWSLETAEERGPRYPSWHPDMDAHHNDAFFQPLKGSRARLVGGGRRNFYLDMLATHTDYRRRGAARLLLEWGCEVADQENFPIYIDSSEEGRPIYERFGFVAQSTTGGLASMVREPRATEA